MVMVMTTLTLLFAGCVKVDKLLKLYLLRLCGKEKRILVHMANAECSEKGIFSCCHYCHYYLLLKPASLPILQLWTLSLRSER